MAERDYAGALPTAPPEGLLPWLLKKGELSKELLIYSTEWYTEPLTGEKMRGVKLTCTACRQSVFTEKVDSDCGHAAYSKAAYGFIHPDTGEVLTGREDRLCPECMTPVTTMHCGSVTSTTYAACHPLTISRFEDKLVLTGWCVMKVFHKNGKVTYITHPYEAYVVEQKGIVQLTAYAKYVGSGVSFHDAWTQRKQFYDNWELAPLIYPWDKRLLTGSTAENSKLDLYIKGAAKEGSHPVTYLRLWQKHPNLENLIMQGASWLIDDAIATEKKNKVYSSRGNLSKALPTLHFIDWKQRQPSKMLGMTKDEFKAAVSGKWDSFDLSFWTSEKSAGRVLTADDMRLVKQFGTVHCLEMSNRGEHDYLKAARYLDKQKAKNKRCDWHILSDYWRIAKETGEDMKLPAVRFPSNLMRAHDRVEHLRKWREEAKKAAERDARRHLFAERYEQLSHLSWEHGGILIRPARSEEELIDEGKALEHCVSSYAMRHMNGEKAIFFVRRASAPDKPWFTLDLNEKTLTVIQNRGKRNCARTKEITAFELRWIAWCREQVEPKKKRRARQRVAVPA